MKLENIVTGSRLLLLENHLQIIRHKEIFQYPQITMDHQKGKKTLQRQFLGYASDS